MNVTFAGSTPPFPPCTISINGYYVVRRTTFSALDQEQIDGCARGRRGATRCAWIFRVCWVVGDRHAVIREMFSCRRSRKEARSTASFPLLIF